jgi:geranylgeranyl diphosphate synthase, type II
MDLRQNRPVGEGLTEYVVEARPLIERSLRARLPASRSDANARFNEALEYALFPGGKRVRPLLTLLAAELVGGDRACVLDAAAAVEYLHNSSLIFDDLPCMDDADTRRGLPSLHKRYGEGLAVLVAINLMNAAYGLVIGSAGRGTEGATSACRELVECIGPEGMLGGQAVDLAARAGTLPQCADGCLEAFRNKKTSALIKLSLRLGATLAGAPAERLAALSSFAELLGNAYQLIDDILDADEDARCVAGPRLAGRVAGGQMEGPPAKAVALLCQAKETILTEFGRGRHSSLICEVTDYVGARALRSPAGQVYAGKLPLPEGHRAA